MDNNTKIFALYENIKNDYLRLKPDTYLENIQGGSKKESKKKSKSKNNKFCNLPKNAKLFFGSGGSDGIIAITPDGFAYKFFPIFVSPYDMSRVAEMEKYIEYEISVIKELTKKVIKPKLSPHIISYIANYKCEKTPDEIFKNCSSYSEYITTKKKSNDQCKLILEKDYPRILEKPMHILQMEKADSSLGDKIKKISNKKFSVIKLFLDVLYFQVFFTLEMIKSIYPQYSHNDLFIRNIMVIDTKQKNNNFYRYHINGKIFDVPADILFIKINDFGMNDLSQAFTNKHKIEKNIQDDPYRDYFSILYDVYDGADLGGTGLYKLIKNKTKLKQIDKYYDKFIKTNVLKKIIKNGKKEHLDWNWGKTIDKNFVKLLDIKLFSSNMEYFNKVFPVVAGHKIANEFGPKLKMTLTITTDRN